VAHSARWSRARRPLDSRLAADCRAGFHADRHAHDACTAFDRVRVRRGRYLGGRECDGSRARDGSGRAASRTPGRCNTTRPGRDVTRSRVRCLDDRLGHGLAQRAPPPACSVADPAGCPPRAPRCSRAKCEPVPGGTSYGSILRPEPSCVTQHRPAPQHRPILDDLLRLQHFLGILGPRLTSRGRSTPLRNDARSLMLGVAHRGRGDGRLRRQGAFLESQAAPSPAPANRRTVCTAVVFVVVATSEVAGVTAAAP